MIAKNLKIISRKFWLSATFVAGLLLLAVVFQNCGDIHVNTLASVQHVSCLFSQEINDAASVVIGTPAIIASPAIANPDTSKGPAWDVQSIKWDGVHEDAVFVFQRRASEGTRNPMICFDIKGNGGLTHDCRELKMIGEVCDSTNSHCLSQMQDNTNDLLNASWGQVVVADMGGGAGGYGDGKPDIVLFPNGGSKSWGDGVILINRGRDSNGTPLFERKVFYNFNYSDPGSLMGDVGDFNGDGIADVAYIERKGIACDEYEYIRTNPDGSTSVGPCIRYKPGGNWVGTFSLKIAFGAATGSPRTVSFQLPNQSVPHTNGDMVAVFNDQSLAMTAKDFNNDGAPEIAVMNDYGINVHYTISHLGRLAGQDGGGCPQMRNIQRQVPVDYHNTWSMTVAHDDMKNAWNLVMAESASSPYRSHIYYGNTDGTFEEHLTDYANVTAQSMYLSDVDQDTNHLLDLVIPARVYNAGSLDLQIKYQQGAGVPGRYLPSISVTLPGHGGNPSGMTTNPMIFTDLDGDGKLDMIVGTSKGFKAVFFRDFH